MIDTQSIHAKLKEFFGYDTFKGDQEEVIRHLVDGGNAFVLMPTGGGKSLCYQLPALLMEGTAIVISPLIALMKNQVDAIRGFVAGNEGIAHFLNSSLNKAQVLAVRDDLLSGVTKLLYVAPESLTKEENIALLKEIKISFYAVDEAHCISEWGHDFRPEYRRIRAIVDEIGRAPIIALTATATPKVQSDILKHLGVPDAKVFKSSFNRPNLYYEVRDKVEPEKDIIKFIRQNPGKSGIIYCLSRKKVEEMAQLLNINGIKALPYHAGLDAKTRADNQDAFLMETPPLLGVRVTRVLDSLRNVSMADAIGKTTYEDVVGIAGVDIDGNLDGKKYSVWERPAWQIPLRSLLPRKTPNLVVAGRCFGYEADITYDAREIATCLVTGQAAGTAAAKALKDRASVQSVDPSEVQSTLRKAGVRI